MKHTWWKIGVVVLLVVAIAAVIAQKQQKQSATPREPLATSASASTEETAPQESAATSAKQPTGASQPQKTVDADAPVKEGGVCLTPPPGVSANASAQGTGHTAAVKGTTPAAPPKTTTPPKVTGVPTVKPTPRALPKLVDVGSTQCIPCKMMAPILDELKTEYKGQLVVEFVDINENRDAAAQYGVETIPTQIFYDANGKEFSRHMGFYPKEDILATFTKQGITLTK